MTMDIDWQFIQLAGVLTLASLTVTQNLNPDCSPRCSLGQECWPSTAEWDTLSQTVTGDFVWRNDADYASHNKMKNARVKRTPAVIVFVENANDVKECVKFAKRFNIRVSIMSSGHSYIGRSAHDGSLLINLSKMKAIQVNADPTTRSDAGEVTVESGNSWEKVYRELDPYNRIVVGGSAHTVGMGGYTQGGGHSPMSRMLGLAVDNLLEVLLVTVDGELITVSDAGYTNHDTGESSTDNDLFWALRGGVGGTWGVVISFTFKLHFPPAGFVQYLAGYPIYYKGVYHDRSLQKVLSLIENLPKEWGGYVVMSSTSDVPDVKGGYLIALLHYGPWGSDSFNAIYPLYGDTNAGWKFFVNRTSFWDYEKTVNDTDLSMYRSYLVNSLIQPGKSEGNLDSVIIEEMYRDEKFAATGCTFTMLGGKMQDVSSAATPINPGFRSATYSLSCARVWEPAFVDCTNIKDADYFNDRLKQFGDGVYFNEPAQYLDDWKTQFWGKGGNYERLLEIKKRWDPCNFFTCHNCVGFDLDAEAEVNANDENKACSGSRIVPTGAVTFLGLAIISWFQYDVI